MDGVATPIIGRPRPLPGHDTPNPAYHPHTLNYEEPLIVVIGVICSSVWRASIWLLPLGVSTV